MCTRGMVWLFLVWFTAKQHVGEGWGRRVRAFGVSGQNLIYSQRFNIRYLDISMLDLEEEEEGAGLAQDLH